MKKPSLHGRRLEIVRHRLFWFGISALVIAASIISLFTLGLDFGVDFTGGLEMEIKCDPGTELADVRAVMADFEYADAQIQQGAESTFTVRTPGLKEGERAEIEEALAEATGAEVLQVNDVGPGWGAQVSRQALIAFIIFLVAVLIYISIRFEYKMAFCAIAALFHDLLITVGVYSLTSRLVTPATVIAVLTILGYSLYDTIVIFDRVKENTDELTRHSKKTYSESVDESINQTLVRSMNTSLTSLIPIVSILLFGGATLKDFAFALFVGVIAGTYSSVFFASPLLATWKETEPKYRAYRERAERRQTRAQREAARGAEGATEAGAGATADAKRKTAPAQAGKKPKGPGAKAAGGKKGKAAGAGAGAPPTPKPVPKPKPASAAKPGAGKAASGGQKSSAKSRTKGPGSGKKKKKKKK